MEKTTVYRLDGLSIDVAHERHADLRREAERERRMQEAAIQPSRLPALVATWNALWSRARSGRRAPIEGARTLRPACQE
jgi:hypothetical protein